MFCEVKTWNGMQFSEIASKVAREVRSAAEASEFGDLVHAPIECNALIWQGHAERLRGILEQAQMTTDEYNAELTARTTAKFAHFSGLELDEFDQRLRWEL